MSPMKITRRGTVEFDGKTLVYDGWIVEGGGRLYASQWQMQREAREVIFIEIARIAGVYLEPQEMDCTGFATPLSLKADKAARQALERIRVETRRPWWRFWR